MSEHTEEQKAFLENWRKESWAAQDAYVANLLAQKAAGSGVSTATKDMPTIAEESSLGS